MCRKQIIDEETGTPLKPSRQGKRCPGNGSHPEYWCCCDECDYYMHCFPQYEWEFKIKKLKKRIKQLFKKQNTPRI
ncbi:MAG: hypothetical protein E7400_04470 [Ruminococcaceae bacterium]|nr:hypothetical protein [Oscillospiraceae bacterium]